MGFVASFASKLSDTVSSEIGKVRFATVPQSPHPVMPGKAEIGVGGYACVQAYGKTTYLITNLQRVPRGTEGAVSLEGSLAGLAAAFGFAFLSYAIGQVGMTRSSHASVTNA